MNDLVRKTEVINELVALTSYKTKLEITEVIEADLSRMDKWLGGVEDCLNAIEAIQPVDAVPVVRCRECYYKDEKRIMDEDALWCRKHHMYITFDWFCADGDRRSDETTVD